MLIGKFSFKRIGITDLGEIFRPYAEILVFSKKRNEWFPIEMVVDTGADYTMLPRRYADLLGIDIEEDCVRKTTLGIGGSENVYFYKALQAKIGKWNNEIPVGFLGRDDIPALLGRLAFLEALKIIFYHHHVTFMV